MPIMGQASGERWTIIERKSKSENQIEDCKMGCNRMFEIAPIYPAVPLYQTVYAAFLQLNYPTN